MRQLREPSFEALHRVPLLGHEVQVGEEEAAAVLAAADRRGRQLEAGLGGREHGLEVTAGAKLDNWTPDVAMVRYRYGRMGRIMMS